MAQIGTFTRTTDGFAGTVRTLMLNRDLVIIPAETSDAVTVRPIPPSFPADKVAALASIPASVRL